MSMGRVALGHAPSTSLREEPRGLCCSRCRRGMPGMQGPCGYALHCPNGCHEEGD